MSQSRCEESDTACVVAPGTSEFSYKAYRVIPQFYNLATHQNVLMICYKVWIPGPHPRGSDSAGVRWGLGIIDLES